MPSDDERNNATAAVHAGQPQRFPYDALTAPVVQTATYSFENTAELVAFMEGRKDRLEYGRYGNPVSQLLEQRVAALEGAEAGVAFASGMAAITTAILALTRSGSHVILFSDCYRRTRQFVTTMLDRFGVRHTLVSPTDLEALQAALLPDTRLVISEAPTNPYLSVLDLPKVADICRGSRAKLLIDATLATPLNFQPLRHGADLVVHSATKYLAGHNDVLAGVVAGSHALASLVRDARDVLGGVCDPHAAYLVHRGLKTLALRMRQHNQTALTVAQALEAHPSVRRVWYPGLESHPSHKVATRLMSGFGGVVTFDLVGDLESTGRFLDRLKLPRIAPSLGGVESLVEQPALMSYFGLTTAQREALGISDTLVRYSVGIEAAEDILADILGALRTT